MPITKARQLAELIANSLVDSDEISTGAVTTSKLADTLDFSSKTMVMADNQLSGDKIHGGTVSAFASTGIDDNASSTTLTITSNGGVGIGTATVADAKLEISGGGIDIQDSSYPRVRFYVGSTFKGGVEAVQNAGSMISTSAVNDLAIRSQSNMLFAAGGNTERMRIDSTGKVGIGTTDPSTNLHIVSGTASEPHILLQNNNSSGADVGITFADSVENYAYRIGTDDTGNKFVFTHKSGGIDPAHGTDTAILSLEPNGNVGVGILDPTNLFHVEGSESGNWISIIKNTHNSNGGGLKVMAGDDANTTAFRVTDYNNNALVEVQGGGNVGIGTTSINNFLHLKSAASGGPQIEIESTSGTANSGFIGFDGTSLQLSTQRDMVDGSKRDTGKSWGGINIIGAATGSSINFGTSEGNNNSAITRMTITKDGKVTVGTTNPYGDSTNGKPVIAGFFTTVYSISSITQTNTWTTVHTFANNAGNFMVSMRASGTGNTSHNSVGVAVIQANGASAFDYIRNGGNVQIRMSGLNLQVYQSVFAGANINWGVTNLGP